MALIREHEQTMLQARLTSTKSSALSKYREMAVGDGGIPQLLRYESAMWFLASMPGGLGYFLRGKLYPSMLRSAGLRLVIGRSVCLRHPKRITLGDGVIVDDYCVLDAKGESDEGITVGENVILARNSVLSCKGGSISIGDNSNISANCMLMSESQLTIGKNVLIAGMTYIVAGGNHVTDATDVPIIRQPMLQRGGVTVEDNCWIGANVTVLDGVTIGRDSIIAAGAVVTRCIPEFAVAAGIPAKVVKYRK
jgi:acetyltransferase-like isoleucine patch superfamily enzyme